MTKEKATARVRVFPSTHKRLRIKSAKSGKTIAMIIDSLEKNEPIRH